MTTMGLVDLSSYLTRSLAVRGSTATSKTTSTTRVAESAPLPATQAAVDIAELTVSSLEGSSSFSFRWVNNPDGTTTLEINLDAPALQDSSSGEANASEDVSTNFGLELSIDSAGHVTLPGMVDTASGQISGDDFTYSTGGVLELKGELAQRLGTDGQSKIDLSAQLDDASLDTLKSLGLIDEGGRATRALQFLSDYAGLDRFKAGQKITNGTDENYGISRKTLNAHRQTVLRLTLSSPSIAQQQVSPSAAVVNTNPDAQVPPQAGVDSATAETQQPSSTLPTQEPASLTDEQQSILDLILELSQTLQAAINERQSKAV